MGASLIAPRAFSRTVDLSPLAAFLAVLVGASLGGLLGALVALPVTAAGKVVLQPGPGRAARGCLVRPRSSRRRSSPSRKSLSAGVPTRASWTTTYSLKIVQRLLRFGFVVLTWPVSLPMLAYYRLARRPEVIEVEPALFCDE